MPETLSLACASAGLGVGGDAVAALRVDLCDGRASSHVWVYHLWGPAWSLWPEQHQGVFVCLENESITRVPPVHLHLPLPVHGPGGDSWRAGRVLHSLCGWFGVLTRAPPKSKHNPDSLTCFYESSTEHVRVCAGMEDFGPGLLLPQPADGCGRFVVGSDPAHSPHADGLHFRLSLPVQHSTGVALPGRGEQRRQRWYVAVSAHWVCGLLPAVQ